MKSNIAVVPQMLRHNPYLMIRVALGFLAKTKGSVIDKRFGKGFTKELALLYFRLTPLCNLRCVMCGQRGDKGVLKGKYAKEEAEKLISLDRYKEIVDEVAKIKPLIYIWGGEPFMYPDFMELADYIVKKKVHMSVNTNGTFLAENAEKIVKDKWGALFVSLDGFEDINDKIRGNGSYRRVIEGFEAINREKKKQNSNLPYMGIVTVINNINYLHLDELTAAVKDFNLAWHIINLGTYTNDSIVADHKKFMKEKLNTDIFCLDGYNTGYNRGIDGEKFKQILKRVHAMDHGYPIITVPTINPDKITEYYSDLDTIVRNKCSVPWSQADIDYNGDVHFCADYPDYVLGNIKEDSFFDIYNNDRAKKFRDTLKESPEGLFPGCVRCYQNMLFGSKKKGY